ncbi:universal stress protein [Noviherbaspirillum sp.]|uniref:universal stress protein n=1 Tax=Noviherbaspirillum sp. TaxID=1926288 RepID=UPI002B466061|nr:universal stress protein [Noviherbaspirillum sp.]HJV83451.1 universal stress protein [Noviherbaspirillum sp.]
MTTLTMYKHILLPTDGSALSQKAVQSGILFAKNTDATVVGIHVIPAPHQDQLEAWMHHDPHYPERRQALFDKFADEYLSFIANSALAEEVPCSCKMIKADEPYLAIVKAAEQLHCDLIFMASHGWKGDSAQVLGSETLKVLIHSKVPVMVHKPGPRDRS